MTCPPDCIVLRGGKFDPEDGAGAHDLADRFSDLVREAPQHLAIYFHGGLVPRQNGLAQAAVLAPEFRAARAEPLFVIWESGVWEIISQNLPAIFDEDIFQNIHRRVSQLVKGKLDKLLGPPGAKSISGLPLDSEEEIQAEIDKGSGMFGDIAFADIQASTAPSPEEALSSEEKAHIEAEIDKDFRLREELRAITAGRTSPGEARSKGFSSSIVKKTLIDPEVLDDIAPIEPAASDEGQAKSILGTIALGKHVVTVVGSVIWRFAHRRDHGPYLTIIEEIMREFYVRAIGRNVWLGMKKAIDAAFEPATDRGGSALVDRLHGMWSSGVKPTVTLIGHSAGAIYVARLLRELDARMSHDFRVNVVLIAPACTFKALGECFRSAASRVANLRIFGMSDPLERKDAIVPVIFPASLLYFVSGVLEDDRDQPLVGMARYYSAPYGSEGFEEIAAITASNALSRQHPFAWAKATLADGANCDMTSHGGWASAPDTLASVKYLLQKGSNSDW